MAKFINCKINTSRFNFLPREETAFWVKKAIKELKEKNEIKILDIFSGTGCIGIAILKNAKNSFVVFGDKSDKAIEQIKINLQINKINKKRAVVVKTNIFSNVHSKYDFIFANPPYVAKERLNEVQAEVKKYEPKIAWYGGKDGMDYISKFLKEAKNFLNKNGEIYFEFDPQQKRTIEEILKKENYKFRFFKDQFKKFRYAKACYKNKN